MSEDGSFLPLEFVVKGTPASQQAGNSKAIWKDKVRVAAKSRIDELTEMSWLDDRPLEIVIYYFTSTVMQGDIDNIVKPILDALNTVAYQDDGVIERVVVQKFEPQIVRTFIQPSNILTEALDAATPLVYIKVDDTLAWRQN